MNRKFCAFVVLLAASSSSIAACSGKDVLQNPNGRYLLPHDGPKRNPNDCCSFIGDNDFPLLGFMPMPSANVMDNMAVADNPSCINYSAFQLYKDAGFNYVTPCYTREGFQTPDVHKSMKICNDLKLGYLVNDPVFKGDSLNGTVQPLSVEEYKTQMETKWYFNEPCFAGLSVKDEPTLKDFDMLGNISNALLEVDPSKLMFCTILPSYAPDEMLQIEEYRKTMSHWEAYQRYTEDYITKTNSQIVSFDYYLNHVFKMPIEGVYSEDFLLNLSYFASICKTYNIDYWAYAAAYGHGGRAQYTSEELKWIVNTQLAFGAKGMVYYTYWSIIPGYKMADWINPTRSGLVTGNGIPHDTYFIIKDINKNIHAIEEILKPSEFVCVAQYGDKKLNISPDVEVNTYSPIYNISGGDALVGIFNNNNKKVFYIINNSINCGIKTFKVSLTSKKNIHLLNSSIDKNIDDSYCASFNLSAGEAVLMEVE